MAVEFIPVTTDEDIAAVAHAADEIWHEYWPGKISFEQVDYMVDTFQSEEALTYDIREQGYEYWLLLSGSELVGYTGAHVEAENRKLFISKIYLFEEDRGKGYASAVIRFYEDLCRERGLESMYLTVNKYNELGIVAYKAKGFEIVESVVASIGHGFVMDDYIMEKKVD